ncbi:DNA cytosine methyltransferase [Haloarcula sp. H-GB4]|uniref:DNA cytosine methyltransferase n=1 Tax=Haloarcula sp. H-GB4 TaxID=3069755 RepID=UPI0027B0BB9E|nr:DNA cytosine methyltransferase [Haloarcula sp. H-GB4]MDQ2074770.1 DNA cytosine methyltransferase [Haloarcula sp. H-GB4]
MSIGDMPSESLTAIDLFCGAGGISTGLQWAGYDISWANDVDDAATETYRKNHPSVDCTTADITTSELPALDQSIDLVAGGPPCPPFSIVGRTKLDSLDGRDATTDSRTQLWKRLRDAVAKYDPDAFVMENVQGMASAENDAGESVLQHICGEFRNLGYSVDHWVVDAADFGVPQRRKRLLIIGTKKDTRPPRLEEWRTHREPKSDRERTARFVSQPEREQTQETLDEYLEANTDAASPAKPQSRVPWVTVAEAISDLPPLSPGGDRASDLHPPAAADRYELPPVTQYQKWAREDAPTVSTENGKHEKLHNHEARYHNLADLSLYSLLGAGTGWRIGDLPDKLQPYREDVFSDNYTKQQGDRPSSTVTAHIHKDGHMHIHPRQARSFTVREAARIQSFPDRFVFPGSRTAAYRQVGNAVPPLLAESAGRAIRTVIEQG